MVNGQAFVLTRQPTQPSSGLPLSATMGRAEQLYGLQHWEPPPIRSSRYYRIVQQVQRRNILLPFTFITHSQQLLSLQTLNNAQNRFSSMVRLTGKKHMEKLLTEICYLLIESINTLTSWRDEQNENKYQVWCALNKIFQE